MARELFLVAQTGGKPTFIFQSMAQAEEALSRGTKRQVEFWHLPTGEYRSADDRWTGWAPSSPVELFRLLGWYPERLVAA